MKAAVLALLLVAIVLAAPAHASIALTALADAAPRSIFEGITDSAPRSADGRDEDVGERQPASDKVREAH